MSYKGNAEMVEVLSISLSDGIFRKELEEIVRSDIIDTLNDLDRQIVIRCKLEG